MTEEKWLMTDDELAALGLTREGVEASMETARNFAASVRDDRHSCPECLTPGMVKIKDGMFIFECEICGWNMAGSVPRTEQ